MGTTHSLQTQHILWTSSNHYIWVVSQKLPTYSRAISSRDLRISQHHSSGNKAFRTHLGWTHHGRWWVEAGQQSSVYCRVLAVTMWPFDDLMLYNVKLLVTFLYEMQVTNDCFPLFSQLLTYSDFIFPLLSRLTLTFRVMISVYRPWSWLCPGTKWTVHIL